MAVAPKVAPKPATASAEAAPAAKAKPVTSASVVRVVNTRSIPVYLSNGPIEPGEEGDATVAELSNMSEFLSRV